MEGSTARRRPRTWAEFEEANAKLMTQAGIAASLRFAPRPTDVIITPFAKCGTTWLQQIVHSLRTGGDLDFDDISRVVPWIETAHDLGIDLDAPQRAEPRAYKSHLTHRYVPKGARYIVALRDPRDALVSGYRFSEGWFFEPGAIGIEEYARKRFLDRSHGFDYWTHLLSWWAQRDNPSVLLLVYEHMKRDLAGTVQRVARFVDIRLTDALLATVLDQASFETMLANKSKYDDLMMRELSERKAGLPPGSDSAKVRKGEVGSHASELPEALVRELDAIWAAVVTPVTGAPDYASLVARLD
jgi:hypothetical protein